MCCFGNECELFYKVDFDYFIVLIYAFCANKYGDLFVVFGIKNEAKEFVFSFSKLL